MSNKIQIGIDSFAKFDTTNQNLKLDLSVRRSQSLSKLIERIEFADKVGLDVFGIGEHYRPEFLDAAPPIILAAAARNTENIILTSAVTVLGATDPVRAFQNFATLDLLSKGRAEMIVGRGSFTEAFPLFGLDFENYDDLFAEKLDLLLKIRDSENVTWAGKFRPPLTDQYVYPRPYQSTLPIWLGVGGSPNSFIRAGQLGLPLMVAIIGGETRRFRPLVDLYRKAGIEAGHNPDNLKVGLHSLGYVAENDQLAANEAFPGYKEMFTQIGQERGFAPVTREGYDSQNGPTGAFVIGSPKTVAEKILRHSEALGGISRFTFQMDIVNLPHEKLMNAIELIGEEVAPIIRSNIT